MKQVHSIQLRQKRELRGWSRGYIAEQVGVDVATVGRWERGERLPHPHHRQKLCMLFEMNAQDLGLLSEAINAQDLALLSEAEKMSDNGMTAPDLHFQPAALNKQESTLALVDEQPLSVPQQTPIPLAKFKTFSIEHEIQGSKALILMNRQNRQRMLQKMYTFWITGVLEESLRGTAFLALELKEQPDAVTDPWMLTLQQPNVTPRPLHADMHISEVYDEADGELLILGEPGSGKTTLLLELARTLFNRATEEETHPIPVVFNLVSWTIKRNSLSDWLLEELQTRYQIPRKLARAWVQAEQILPLLDGLDEVPIVARSACIEAINAYRQEHSLLPVVVCSRFADYFTQNTHLLLRRAVVVQPLSQQQIEAYLSRVGEPLSTLQYALQRDATLRELAACPLMLNILTLTYQDKAMDAHFESLPLESRRREVLAMYVERMLVHRKGQSHYTAKQTRRWLSWLARQLVQQQQNEFYIERMQPSWLPNSQAFRWYCFLLIGVLAGLFGGIIGMLADVPLFEMLHMQLFILFTHLPVSAAQCAYTLPAFATFPEVIDSLFSLPTVGLLYGIAFGLIGGLLGGRGSPFQASGRRTRLSKLSQRGLASLVGLGCGSIFLLINLIWVPCPLAPGLYNQLAEELSYGLAGVLAGGLVGGLTGELFGARKNLIQPVEDLVWTRASSRRKVLAMLLGGASGIVVGVGTELTSEIYLRFSLWQTHSLICGLLGGLLGTIIGGTIGGLSHHMLEKSSFVRPNEGIRRSARNSLLIGLPLGLALSGFILALTFWLIPANMPDGLLWCIPSVLLLTLLLILLNGGYAFLQHAILRLVLSCQGYIPWNYARFLDEATEKLLLRKVGGGYIFIYRPLLDYFAFSTTDAQEEQQAPASEKADTCWKEESIK
jgi:transcriptional regulator with XRE-family HTH domain/DNA polymerase III delta prime subunit